jgi:hypothetical protein
MPTPYEEPIVDEHHAGRCPACGQPIADALGEMELAE